LDHDSGWFAGVERDGKRADSEQMAVPIAESVGSCPQWVPYLALPPGYRLVFRDPSALERRFEKGGTDGSNPAPSSSESGELSDHIRRQDVPRSAR
jgi:hypothetical protein